MKKVVNFFVIYLVIFTVNLQAQDASAQNIQTERVLHQNILKTIKNELKEKYFDPNLRGIDLEANAKKAGQLIDQAKTASEMEDIIATYLMYPFEDSHVFYIPPSKTQTVEYGWDVNFIGDKAFVTSLEEDSDAYKKGVRIGDQIYMVNEYILNRKEFSLFQYHINLLRPQNSLNVLLIKPSGNKYKVEIKSKVKQESVFLPSSRDLNLEAEREYNERTKQLFNDEIPGLAIWKMPNFELSETKLEKMMDKVRKNNSLILDLRGNPGGYVAAMMQLASHFFETEVNVGSVKERDGLKSMILKPKNKDNYKGQTVILIDSSSASGSEAFARLMQIEKRAIVIGDQSAGALTVARVYYHTFGINSRIPYGISVTVAEMFMKDGKRLEKVGVTPDEKLLPSATDLANNRDPVLARAAAILGFQMTAEQAGLTFADKKK